MNNKGWRAQPLEGEQREAVAAQVAQRYARGETLRSIAASLDRSYGAVHTLAVEGGTAFRSRGWPKGVGWARTTPGLPEAHGRPDPNHDVDAELRRLFRRTDA